MTDLRTDQVSDGDSNNGPAHLKATRGLVSNAHRLFLLTATAGLLSIGTWSYFTQIDVVTRGSGQIVPSLQNQFVQHLEGGIIDEILVREGQTVQAGDVLMRITDSFSEAEYAKVSQELVTQKARLARLDAESRDIDVLEFPEMAVPIADEMLRDERLLFERRRANLNERVLILKDQALRKGLEKRETETRLTNTRREFELMAERVASLENLVSRGAASRNEMLKSQSTLQQIKTKIGDMEFKIPQIEAELSELARRQTEARLAFTSQADEEKIETIQRIEQLETVLLAMTDRNRRTDVRAPIDGKVHRLFQTTIGGVVSGGQNLAQLVPTDAPISVEIRLSPKDRGKVWADLPAVVKLTAYDFSTFGGISAKVTDISSDVFREEGSEPYYRVKLQADTNDFGDGRPIVAGMAAEVDIITGQRTIMNYILSPVRDISEKALREG